MKLLLFRTDIKTKKKVNSLKPLFNTNVITNWSVDTEDIDNVLRIEAKENLNESDVIELIEASGHLCEPLPD
tara:strand:- start:165686 stop:165901 length:216 start_codon:yes stop_codon:yes gene_type:complete